MAINQQLLDCLVCPVSRQKLHQADQATVDALNALIAQGQLANKQGVNMNRPLDGGLIRGDKTVIYPVYDDIPNLLADEAIEVPESLG